MNESEPDRGVRESGDDRGSIRVLVVEEPDTAEVVAAVLEREGIHAVTESDADAALDRVADGSVDCVVSDYDVPGSDGLAFLEAVRRIDEAFPFVLFTGEGSEAIASEAIARGVTDYVPKGQDYDILVNRIRNAVESFRSRRRAAELERINDVFGAVDRALVGATTREEVGEAVCSILADADRYRFAWVGEYDPETDAIDPIASSGRGDGYLDAISVSADPDAPVGQGPGGRAIRSRSVEVVQNVPENAAFKPWREEAIERGYRSAAAVPLVVDDEVVGMLGVYSDRTDAFDDAEREMLADLGVTVARAMDAAIVREQLEREREQSVGIVEAIPDLVTVHVDGRFRYVNEAGVDLLGADDREDLIGRSILDVVHPDDRPDIEAMKGEIQDGNVALDRDELQLRGLDGEVHHVRGVATRVEWDGEPAVLSIARDVTAERERERRLQAERDRFTALFESVPEPVAHAYRSEDGAVANVVNSAFEATFGYDREAAVGEVLNDLIVPEEERDAAETMELRSWEEPMEREIRRETVDGVRDFLFRSVPLDADPPEAIGIYVDITDRKERERKIAGLQAAARDLLSAETAEAVAGIAVETAREHFGFDLSGVHLVEEGEDGRVLAPVSTTDAVEQELDGVPSYSRDGDGGGRAVWNVYESGEPWHAPDLTEAPEVDDDETPVRSAIVHPLGDHGVFVATAYEVDAFDETDRALVDVLAGDVTAALDRTRREQQLRDREAELERQNERLERFASIVSHDLRNPIEAAHGYLELLAATRDLDDDDHVEGIRTMLDRMADIVDDVLSLTWVGEGVEKTEPIALSTAVHESMGAVEPGVELVVEGDPVLRVDRSQFGRLLENLLRNVADHADADVVRVGPLGGDGDDPGTRDATAGDDPDDDEDRPGDAARSVDAGGFYVEDDGVGIDPADRDLAFEKGYSGTEGGTGFGLAIVAEVADAHGWSVDVVEGRDGGTRFEFREA